jgi:hypothetical protein
VRTNSKGVAIFSGLKTARAGHYTVIVTVTGLKTPLTQSITIKSLPLPAGRVS